MRLTCTVVWKSWVSDPLRTALTVLGIALGVATVVAIHTMDHNTVARGADARARFDLELRPARADRPAEEVLEALAGRADVAAVGAWREARAGLVAGGAAPVPVTVLGLTPLAGEAFGHYRVAEGAEPADDPEAGTVGVLVGPGLVEGLELAPGDEVTLGRPPVRRRIVCRDGEPVVVEVGPREPVTVAAVVSGVLAYERAGRRDFGRIVVAPLRVARALGPAAPTVYQVRRRSHADLDRLRRSLLEDYSVLDRRSALLGERADERAFRNGVKVLGGLALVVGMFGVFQTLSLTLVERLRQLALLRCLGVGRGGVAGIFLWDALGLGVAGVVLGVPGGLGLAALLRAAGVSSLGLGKEWSGFAVPLVPVLWTVGLALVFTLAGAAFPLWKARSLSPVAVLGAHGLGGADVLRGVHRFLFVLLVGVLPLAYLAMTPLLSAEGREMLLVLGQIGALVLVFGALLLLAPGVVRWVGAAVLLPVRWVWTLPAFLVRRALGRNPGRFAAAVCGLAVVLTALVGLKSITAALRAEVRAFGAVALHDRLFLETDPAQPVTPEQAGELEALAGVEAVEALRGRQDRGLLVSGLPVGVLARDGGPLHGAPDRQRAFAKQRCVVVSRRLAAMNGLAVDDAVALRDHEGGAVAYRVIAVSDAAGYVPDERAWAVTAPRWMVEDFCVPERSVRHLVLRLRPGTDPRRVAGLARAQLGGIVAKAKTGRSIEAYHLRDVVKDFLLFDVLLFLVLVLAGMGLVNGMTIAALGRAREIGVLRALGMDRRALRGAFLLEGALVGLLAALLAVGLAVPLGRLIVTGLNEVAGLEAPFAVPWRWVAAVPVVALVVGVLAAVVPGLRATRVSPARAVRYE